MLVLELHGIMATERYCPRSECAVEIVEPVVPAAWAVALVVSFADSELSDCIFPKIYVEQSGVDLCVA